MLYKENYIVHDFNLPNHENELFEAEEVIEKFKEELLIIKEQKSINNELHLRYYEHIIKILDYVGRLSMSVFDIENELEEMYKMKYIKAPELCKKIWLDHYDSLHHPYSILKNRCFRLLDELDAEYFNKFNKHPPNWKP
jgi:hypothetical protein